MGRLRTQDQMVSPTIFWGSTIRSKSASAMYPLARTACRRVVLFVVGARFTRLPCLFVDPVAHSSYLIRLRMADLD
jgi:hypothetical protein